MQELLSLKLLLNLIIPFVMVSVGAAFKKHPPSDVGSQLGYQSPASRKSQAHWDYAQKIAPGIFIAFGKYLFVAEIMISILLLLLQVSIKLSVIIGECIGFCFLFYTFYYTDRKIEEKFADNQIDKEVL